ncbi:MAG: hypothetical protein GF372_03510 [Candidatus Marinimicrobia bacterium]|nr:hypothetical protein [Candidatus Neomarinimicrobiota bacterium]
MVSSENRERAFYGAYLTALAPLQMVTSPSIRLVPPVFKILTTGEYDRLSSYYIWTIFPFGRLARDVMGSVDKMNGLPYVQLQREMDRKTVLSERQI